MLQWFERSHCIANAQGIGAVMLRYNMSCIKTVICTVMQAYKEIIKYRLMFEMPHSSKYHWDICTITCLYTIVISY